MKLSLATTAILGLLAAPALAESHASGDAAAGEKAFNKCKSCHAIVDAEGNAITKGGKTGPNLFGLPGATAGTVADFSRYKDGIVAAGEAGLVWDEENLAEYIKDPKAFLQSTLDDSGAKSKMTFKMKKGGEDVAAYLATFSSAEESEEGSGS